MAVITALQTALEECWAFRSENVTQFTEWVNKYSISNANQNTLAEIIDSVFGDVTIPRNIYGKDPTTLTDDEKSGIYQNEIYGINAYSAIDSFCEEVTSQLGGFIEFFQSKTFYGVYFLLHNISANIDICKIKIHNFNQDSRWLFVVQRLNDTITFPNNEDYTLLPDITDNYGGDVQWRGWGSYGEPLGVVYEGLTASVAHIPPATEAGANLPIQPYSLARKLEMRKKSGYTPVNAYPITIDSLVKLSDGRTLKQAVTDAKRTWAININSTDISVKEILDNVSLRNYAVPSLNGREGAGGYLVSDLDYIDGIAWDQTGVFDLGGGPVGVLMHITYSNPTLASLDPEYDRSQDIWATKTYTFSVNELNFGD